MKYMVISVIALLGLSVFLRGEEVLTAGAAISPQEAAQNEGKSVTVKGLVEDQKTAESGTTFLNFGGKFPNHVFSCRLFAKNFPDGVPSFVGKVVEVTGSIRLFKGKPSMDLAGPDKIKVLETVDEAEKPAP